jgi:hypothetical protein
VRHVIHRFPGSAEPFAGSRLEWSILVVLVLQRVLSGVFVDRGRRVSHRRVVGEFGNGIFRNVA